MNISETSEELHYPQLSFMNDVSSNETSSITNRNLDESGMEELAVPINLDLEQHGRQMQFAKARATVNTKDGFIKGIHMSRLYLELSNRLEKQLFSFELVKDIVKNFLTSHKTISSQAQLELAFNWPRKRSSLNSGYGGWRQYPIKITCKLKEDGEYTIRLGVSITYASFCPCSASLARQLIQRNFVKDFANSDRVDVETVRQWLGRKESINAVPHGQRSTAEISFDLVDSEFSIPSIIDYLESQIKTPVQTAVKRSDEQEFASICGENLMFVEDAAKLFYRAIKDYHNDCRAIRVSVAHHESLHAHDAVAVINESESN